MNTSHLKLTALFTGIALIAFVGCGKKQPDANAELDKAAKAMGASANNTPAPAPQPAPQQAVAPAPTPAPTPAVQMQQAMTAYKSDQLTDAVAQLQVLRSRTAMTPEQRVALQDAMAAVMADIYARAAKGDARAQQAIKEYQRWQTGGR